MLFKTGIDKKDEIYETYSTHTYKHHIAVYLHMVIVHGVPTYHETQFR